MGTAEVEVSGLNVSRGGVPVLQDVDLRVAPGQIVGLLGPSGSGKSTLLRCINRLLEPPPNSVHVGGQDVTAVDVLELRKRVGMVFQQPQVLPGSVADNLRFGPLLHGAKLNDDEIAALLDLASLDPRVADKPADELSGGEAQRVAMARTLANHPQVLLLDEPTSALDPASRRQIEEMIEHAAHDEGISVLWVTHYMEQAERVADYLFLLVEGRVEDQGRPDDVLAEDKGAANLLRRFAAGELEASDHA